MSPFRKHFLLLNVILQGSLAFVFTQSSALSCFLGVFTKLASVEYFAVCLFYLTVLCVVLYFRATLKRLCFGLLKQLTLQSAIRGT